MSTLKKEAKSLLYVALGTLLLAIGVYFFKVPNGFATGGVSGIATVLGKLTDILTPGQWIMLINVALLIVGALILGKETGLRTVFCSLLFSATMNVLELVFPLSAPLSNQPFLELVYSMIFTGAGSALIFYNKASSGGTDIIALILKKFLHMDVGRALLFADLLIALSTFFVFGIEAGLFSILGLFSKSFLVDAIIDHLGSCKYFIVITSPDKSDSINRYIMSVLDHSSTKVTALGGYSGEQKVMLHTVCRRVEAIRLRQHIREMDPNAFLIITTTSEIIGNGFRSV